MKSSRILSLTVCGVLLCGIAGCNYSSRNALPEHIKTVAVPVFRNSTHLNEYARGVEVELTQAVRKALLQAGELRLSGREDGDLIVEGDVRELERNVIRSDRYGDPAEIRMTVRAKISAYDVKRSRWLIRDRIVTNGDLRPESGVYNLRRGEPESWARQQALEDLGRRIARVIVEIW